MLTLKATKRNTSENLATLRKSGKLPGVFYGAKAESTPITLDTLAFDKAFAEAGESTVLNLSVDGEKDLAVLVHEVVHDPVTDRTTHVDFYVVDKDKKVTVDVPIVFTNEEKAVKGGGVLVKVLHELEVEGFPQDLPHDITIDLSGLTEIGQHISVKDIVVPAGVIIKTNPDETAVLLAAPKEEKEEEAAPIDLESIEVEKKGKKEEEGEEAAAEAGAEEK